MDTLSYQARLHSILFRRIYLNLVLRPHLHQPIRRPLDARVRRKGGFDGGFIKNKRVRILSERKRLHRISERGWTTMRTRYLDDKDVWIDCLASHRLEPRLWQTNRRQYRLPFNVSNYDGRSWSLHRSKKSSH